MSRASLSYRPNSERGQRQPPLILVVDDPGGGVRRQLSAIRLDTTNHNLVAN
jgi:hypothetical protein